MQFYEPGWVPQFTGFGCVGTKWCVSLTIDSLNIDQNTGTINNAACANLVGLEPVNWAYLTFNGKPHGAPDPISLLTGGSAGNPDPTTDLQMNPGDRLRLHMFDTPAGFKVVLNDLTTGQTGSMTASAANGFQQILYQPNSQTCNEQPYSFHRVRHLNEVHALVVGRAHVQRRRLRRDRALRVLRHRQPGLHLRSLADSGRP